MKYRVLIPLAMIPLLAFAQSFEDGWEAYENARFGDALSILEPLADAGDASSQFALARMYETGRGVEASQVEAVRWYRLAANGGHRLAQFVMGLKYST
ncbi:MAG: sel1 repeat family protein, partial [Proteobacteria bacterium]